MGERDGIRSRTMMVISGKKQARMPHRSPLRPLLRAMVIVMKMKMTQAKKKMSHQKNANAVAIAATMCASFLTDGTSCPVSAALVPLAFPGGSAW